jgi:glycosyltransferase involved in cell wall biosynthesis
LNAADTASPRPLHILVVTNLYPSPAHPAFGTFVGAHVAALRAFGMSVDVVAILDDRAHQRVVRKYVGLVAKATRAALRARSRGRRYDIVEAHIAFPTGFVAWLARVLGGDRLVLFCHGSDVLRLPWASAVRETAARWLLHRADLVVANSRYVAATAEQRLGPLRRPAAVISPGISLQGAGTSVTPDREPGSILFVGRLVKGKGIDVLVDAMATVQTSTPVHLTIVGDGPLRADLEGLARHVRIADAVTFAGFLPPSDVHDLYRRTAVVVVPSVEAEGLNLVVLEAMANGAIVVATTVGGLAETMRDGVNGIVVEPGDPVSLTAGLDRALAVAGAPEGDRMRAAATATAVAHDRQTAIAETVRRYRELLAS